MPVEMPKPSVPPAVPHHESYSTSDKLAIALFFIGAAVAIAAVLVALFLDSPYVLVGLTVLFGACWIYPVLHFFKRTGWRAVAFVVLGLLTTGMGVGLWKYQKPTPKLHVRLAHYGMRDNAQIAYGIIDASEIVDYKATYRLMLAVRAADDSIDWEDDPLIEKSRTFTIEREVRIEIPVSSELRNRLLIDAPQLQFIFGAIPENVKLEKASTIKDLINAGGYIELGGSMGPPNP